MKYQVKTYQLFRNCEIVFAIKSDLIETALEATSGKHMHHLYEILFITKGGGKFFIENNCYDVEANTLLLIKPNRYHYLMLDDSHECYERINFCVSYPNNFLPEELLCEVFDRHECIKINKDAYLFELLSRTKKYYEMFEDEKLFLLLKGAIAEFLCVLSKREQPNIANAAAPDPLISSAIEYINQNLATIDSMDDIAKSLFVSPSTLYHKFNKDMKISIMKYVRNKRLHFANSLLAQGQKPSRIYELCGFNDYTNFYRAYKSFFGFAPSQYRELPTNYLTLTDQV